MNKYLVMFGLIWSILFAQFDDIPYDWAGQYGVLSNNGQLMWNQDWQVGVLLFDGTLTNYPTRFGDLYQNNFLIKYPTDYYSKIDAIPDSTKMSSKLNYHRGDFSHDQLEINLNFEETNRIISLTGFKRTYQGPYGQYTNPDGSNNPLQQSYRVDYLSQNDEELLEFSIGYFHTDSRLQLNDPADFLHMEKIASAGIGYSREFDKWAYNAHGALFQQYYKFSNDSTKSYLNRIHLNQFLTKQFTSSSIVQLGFETDNQGIAVVDKNNNKRTWSTLYGGWKNKYSQLKIGTSIAKKEVVPFFNFTNRLNIGNIGNLVIDLSYSAKPIHMFYWSNGDNIFDKWLIADINGNFKINKIPLNINLYFANTNSELNHKYYQSNELIKLSENLISSSINAELPLIRTWKLELLYRHIFEHNKYSDGISDRINIGLNISENLFNNKMKTNLKLWSDSQLNHNSNLGYEGFHFGPYVSDDEQLTLPDYWVVNLDFSIKVSKMTIGWKIYNILKTAEAVTDKVFPDINENYLLISNSNNFPPMNRFVTMNIIWEFAN